MGDQFHVVRDTEPERGFIIAAVPHGTDATPELEEMRELLRTAKVDTVGTLVQHRELPDRRTYLGSGKVEELAYMLADTRAEVLICDDELSPTQQRSLEERLKVRVADRTAVILDIFASHAHTAEGKLQVELAQLEYQLPRMRGMWKHLERLGGGVGTRGPGESQLETDRRLARTRITLVRRRLKEVGQRRGLQRRERVESATPSVALAGYTNVGKSSLLNALTGATVSTADRLFETLDPTTRQYVHAGRAYTLTDTVGFIRKLPHGLVEAFASTLEETLSGDLLVLVEDASADEEERRAQEHAVEAVLGEIDAAELPRIVVMNKIDLLDADDRRRLANAHPDAILVSARTGEGLEELEERIAAFFADRFEAVELLIPYEEGAALASLYALGAPIVREDAEGGVQIRAHLPVAEARRLARFAVDGGPER